MIQTIISVILSALVSFGVVSVTPKTSTLGTNSTINYTGSLLPDVTNIRDIGTTSRAYNGVFNNLTVASCTGCSGGGFGQSWEISKAGYLAPTTTPLTVLMPTGFISSGSSTIPAYVLQGLSRVGNSTYGNLQDLMNLVASPGITSGGSLSTSSNASASAALTGIIRVVNDDVSTTSFFDLSASSTISIPTNQTRYVGVTYNSGSPALTVQTARSGFDLDTSFPIGTCTNDGSRVYCTSNPWETGDPIGNIMERFDSQALITKDNRPEYGGIAIASTGTRNVSFTSGQLLTRLSEITFNAFDSSASKTFDRYYRDGSGGWTKEQDQTQWPNASYDDNTGTLHAATLLAYVPHWFYVCGDSVGSVVMLYGQSDYTSLATAIASTPPASAPSRVQEMCVLAGRIIAQQGTNTAAQVVSYFSQSAPSSSLVTNHSQLAGLTADDHTQYALLAGRSTGQTLQGGTGASETLTLQGTSNATAGNILLNNKGGNIGIINTSPSTELDVFGDVTVGGGDIIIGNGRVASTTLHGEYGHFGIGTTSPYAQVAIESTQGNGLVGSNTPIFVIGDSGSTTPFFQVNWDGGIGIATATDYGAESRSGNGLSVGTSTLFGQTVTIATNGVFKNSSTATSTYVSGISIQAQGLGITAGGINITAGDINTAGVAKSSSAASSSLPVLISGTALSTGLFYESGTGTSSFEGGINVKGNGGITSASGLNVSGGDALFSGVIKVASTGTSTFAGTIAVNLTTGTSTISSALIIKKSLQLSGGGVVVDCVNLGDAAAYIIDGTGGGNCFYLAPTGQDSTVTIKADTFKPGQFIEIQTDLEPGVTGTGGDTSLSLASTAPAIYTDSGSSTPRTWAAGGNQNGGCAGRFFATTTANLRLNCTGTDPLRTDW